MAKSLLKYFNKKIATNTQAIEGESAMLLAIK